MSQPAATTTATGAVVTPAPIVPTAPTTTDSKVIPPEGLPGTKNERSFIALKPDAVQRGLIGEIIQRFEKKGFKLAAMKFVHPTLDMAKTHYEDLKSTKFYEGLTKFFSSGPVVAMVWEGENVIKGARKMMGETKPADSLPGTIRGDYCINVGRNIIHGSDGPVSAAKEINFWFQPNEIVSHTPTVAQWIYE